MYIYIYKPPLSLIFAGKPPVYADVRKGNKLFVIFYLRCFVLYTFEKFKINYFETFGVGHKYIVFSRPMYSKYWCYS